MFEAAKATQIALGKVPNLDMEINQQQQKILLKAYEKEQGQKQVQQLEKISQMQSFMKPEKELSLRKKQDTQARAQSTPAIQDKVMKAMQKDKLWRIVNEGPLKSAMGG